MLKRIALLILLLVLLGGLSSQIVTAQNSIAKKPDNYRLIVLKAPTKCIDECGRPPILDNHDAQYDYQMCIADCHPKIDYLHQTIDSQNNEIKDMNNTLEAIQNTFTKTIEMFNVDSFFDVFVEIKTRIENLEQNVESFFDIFVTKTDHNEDITNLQSQIDELKHQCQINCGNGICDDNEDEETCPTDCVRCRIDLPVVNINNYSWVENYSVFNDEEIAWLACKKLEELLGDKLCVECFKHYIDGWDPSTGAYLVQIHASSIGHSHSDTQCNGGTDKFVLGYNNDAHNRLEHCMNPTEIGRIDMYYGGTWQGCHDTAVGHFSCGKN